MSNELRERLDAARSRAAVAIHPLRLQDWGSPMWLWNDVRLAELYGVPLEESVSLAESAASDAENATRAGRAMTVGALRSRAWWVLRCATCSNRPVAAAARVDGLNLLWVRTRRGDMFRWVPSAGPPEVWGQCQGDALWRVSLDELEGRASHRRTTEVVRHATDVADRG